MTETVFKKKHILKDTEEKRQECQHFESWKAKGQMVTDLRVQESCIMTLAVGRWASNLCCRTQKGVRPWRPWASGVQREQGVERIS